MEMTKEELQRRINELTTDLARGESETEQLKRNLGDAQRRMAVVDRPKITRDQMTDLQDAIWKVISNTDFTDSNNYDMDFEVDYDNRIAISSMEFNSSEEISEEICEEVSALFNIVNIEDEDEDEA